MAWDDNNDDYYGDEVETWWLYLDSNRNKRVGKVGLMDDTDIDYYIEEHLCIDNGDQWIPVDYDEDSHYIYVKRKRNY